MLLSACTFSQSAKRELDIVRTLQEHGGVSYEELMKKMEEFRKEENNGTSSSSDITVKCEGVSGKDSGVGEGIATGEENVNSPKQEMPSDKVGMVHDPSSNTDAVTKQFENKSDSSTRISEPDLSNMSKLNPNSTGDHESSESRDNIPQQESTANSQSSQSEVPEKKALGQVGDSGLGMEELALSDSVSSCDQ